MRQCYTQKHSYGFRAKVSDYGILRELDSRGFATPQCYPILAHLAPEVLLHGKVSKVLSCFIVPCLLQAFLTSGRDNATSAQMPESMTLLVLLILRAAVDDRHFGDFHGGC